MRTAFLPFLVAKRPWRLVGVHSRDVQTVKKKKRGKKEAFLVVQCFFRHPKAWETKAASQNSPPLPKVASLSCAIKKQSVPPDEVSDCLQTPLAYYKQCCSLVRNSLLLCLSHSVFSCLTGPGKEATHEMLRVRCSDSPAVDCRTTLRSVK